MANKVYKVRHGDTLASIAQAHGCTVDDLLEANRQLMLPGVWLWKGQFVSVPRRGK